MIHPDWPVYPITADLPRLGQELTAGRNCVLVATPGAGKTTLVPLSLLDAPWLGGRKIVMLQPRRVAAVSATRRMAALHGSPLGETVGYQVRFQRCIGPKTRIEVLTEGLLTRRLQNDPFLEGTGLVIFDEFHERSLHADLGLALAREIRETVRPDLRLLVMSATLDAGPVANWLGQAPIIEGKGFLHPVTVRYVGALADDLCRSAVVAIRRILREEPWGGGGSQHSPESSLRGGDLLVFLPGAGEIARVQRLLEEEPDPGGARPVPLHGSLPLDRQDEALQPRPWRKIILSTNIAETSLTIEGVTTVIDTGWCRQLRLDGVTGLERLERERISRASADQRAGRAGRLGPGLAVRLWTERDHQTLPPATPAEILRVDLGRLVLELAAWGRTNPDGFGWFQAPPPAALASAISVLRMLGAIDASGAITPRGRRMVELPVSPRVAAMLLHAAGGGMARQGAELAALLSERDLLVRDSSPERPRGPVTVARSDLLFRLDLLAGDRHRDRSSGGGTGVDGRAARQIGLAADQLADLVSRGLPRAVPPASPTSRENLLLQAVLAGFPDRVCRRRARVSIQEQPRFLMVGGRGLVLDAASVVRDAELVVAVGADGDLIRLASQVEPAWLEEMFPEAVRETRELFFDVPRLAVAARRVRRYHDLALREHVGGVQAEDQAEAERLLAREAARRFDEAFPPTEEWEQFTARVRLARTIGEGKDFPALDQAWFAEHLVELVGGCRSFEDLRRLSLPDLVRSGWNGRVRQQFERLVPERLEVPTGSRIRLQYRVDGPPVLAVKLQELFGWTTSPCILNGFLPVVVHLLSPAGRPLQVTQDLYSFWTNAYPALRREMRGQYPRHPWPEDPLTAPPQRGTVKRPR